MSRNRIWNAKNGYQGEDIRVLCVCSAGLLRSPTMARLLCRMYKNVNPRAVGHSKEYALFPLEEVHLLWAHIVLVTDEESAQACSKLVEDSKLELDSITIARLDIPDDFRFGDQELEKIMMEYFTEMNKSLEVFNRLIPICEVNI